MNDRAWFDAHPGRRHCFRLAVQAEVDALGSDAPLALSCGRRDFVVLVMVRALASYRGIGMVRTRHFFTGGLCLVDDDEAAEVARFLSLGDGI